jgi:hypothetical protein
MTEEIDFDSRRLCPNGACIGVIGPEGRCKVCGTVDDGAPQVAVSAPAVATAEAEDEDEREAEQPQDSLAAADDDGDDDERELCPDGTCIGLIGPDGRCKVCGSLKGS